MHELNIEPARKSLPPSDANLETTNTDGFPSEFPSLKTTSSNLPAQNMMQLIWSLLNQLLTVLGSLTATGAVAGNEGSPPSPTANPSPSPSPTPTAVSPPLPTAGPPNPSPEASGNVTNAPVNPSRDPLPTPPPINQKEMEAHDPYGGKGIGREIIVYDEFDEKGKHVGRRYVYSREPSGIMPDHSGGWKVTNGTHTSVVWPPDAKDAAPKGSQVVSRFLIKADGTDGFHKDWAAWETKQGRISFELA